MKKKVISVILTLVLLMSFSAYAQAAPMSLMTTISTKTSFYVVYTHISGMALSEYPSSIDCDFEMYSDGLFASSVPLNTTNYGAAYDLTYVSSKLVRQDGMWRVDVTYNVKAWDLWGGESTGRAVYSFN